MSSVPTTPSLLPPRDRLSRPAQLRTPGLFAIVGTGIVVMLADTDAGSIITAAESGAQWGYRLLLLQIVLIPVLYVVQELTVRLGVVTGKGHGELILAQFGRGWAWLSVSTLAIACLGALISELSGLAGAGLLFGVPAWATVLVVVGGLVAVVWTGSYRAVEKLAVGFGALELLFIWIAWRAHPSVAALVAGMANMPLHNHAYLYLATANIGAVIMPWMVFYQQSAVIEKTLNCNHLKTLRWETAGGAVLTQLVMIGVLIATAATIGRVSPNAPLDTVQDISRAITPFLGESAGRAVFALGISGAALVATIVVSLTAAWGVGEVAGYRRSLADHPREAPWFYGVFTVCLVLAGALVASGANLVALSVGVQVLNALLLPVVLGFLYALAVRALPEEYRLKGVYAWAVGAIMFVTAGFGIFAAIAGAV
ncbi:MAG TPA: divalent metal cation transporter [Rhizomicrobium sp.]|nr:divalent metal cation transporter [Rhizomicrobium sp.]